MSTLLKIIVVAMAIVAGFAWIGVASYLGEAGKPYAIAVMAAYPLLGLLGIWVVGFLGAIAITCNLNENGVTVSDAFFCAVPGSILALAAGALAVFCGPFIAGISLGAKWFPGKPSPPKPANHWSRRIVFRCPGKPHRSLA